MAALMSDDSTPDNELAAWETLQDALTPWLDQLRRDRRAMRNPFDSVDACHELVSAHVAEHALLKELRDAWPHPGQGCIGLGLVEDTQHAANMAAVSHGLLRDMEHRQRHRAMLCAVRGDDHAAGDHQPELGAAVLDAISKLHEPDWPPGDWPSDLAPIHRKRRAALSGCAAAVAPPTVASVERLLNTG